MGAGPLATGTYMNGTTGVDCIISSKSEASQSNEKLKCAFKWYLENPLNGTKLMWKKSYHLWSPWFGPLAGGTNALHPYYQSFHPIKSNIRTQEQFDLVFGPIGKFISWIWILGSWVFLLWGFIHLWVQKNVSQIIGIFSFLFIILNWVSCLITIGDSRYRIPLMSISLLVQTIGIRALIGKLPNFKNRKSKVF
jgi:hypothetical protein